MKLSHKTKNKEIKGSLVNKDSKKFFRDKKRNAGLIVLGFFILSYFSSHLLDFDFMEIFKRGSSAIARFFKLYTPPRFDEMDKLLDSLFVTFLLSAASATIGSIIAYIFALNISKKTASNPIIRHSFRLVAAFIRNVPTSIWAILLLMAFWFGEFLALIVMTLGTLGFNARVFADIIDESSSDSIDALNAVGASKLQTIFQSVLPETMPSVVSWTLYAVETNIRSSTIIGMLAGGGIGHMIGIYKDFRKFAHLSGAVVLVVALILIFDRLSIHIRKSLLA